MFFFIPIGHEDSKIRRFPLSSALILIACCAAFGQTWHSCQADKQRARDGLMAVVRELMVLVKDESEESAVLSRAFREGSEARDARAFLETLDRAVARCEERRVGRNRLESLKAQILRARELLDGGVFYRYGLVPKDPQVHAFFTHMFLHGGFLHLICNIIFFILVGPTLEDLWGRAAFLVVYVVAGLFAALGFMLVSGPIPVPMIGASGAIAGLTGAFLVTFTRTRIKMLGVVFLFYVGRVFTFSTPAWVFLPVWIGMEIIQGVMQLGSVREGGGGVAHWAHIAGFFFGVGVPFIFRWTGLDRKIYPAFIKNAQGQNVRVCDGRLDYMLDAEARKGARLREEGDHRGAAACFESVVKSHPELLGPRLDLAEAYREDGEDQKRRETLLEALAVAATAKDERIAEVYWIVRREYPKAPIPAEALFRAGVTFEREGRFIDALECLRKFTSLHPQHPLWIKAAVRLADILTEQLHETHEAQALLLKAREAAVDTAWRQEVDRRLAAQGQSTPEVATSPGPAVHGDGAGRSSITARKRGQLPGAGRGSGSGSG